VINGEGEGGCVSLHVICIVAYILYSCVCVCLISPFTLAFDGLREGETSTL